MNKIPNCLSKEEKSIFHHVSNYFNEREKLIKQNPYLSTEEIKKINDIFLSIFKFKKCLNCNMYESEETFCTDPKRKTCYKCYKKKTKSKPFICLKCKGKLHPVYDDAYFFSEGRENCLCKNCFPYCEIILDRYYIYKHNSYKVTHIEKIILDFENLKKELKLSTDIKKFNSLAYIIYSIANYIHFKKMGLKKISKKEEAIYKELVDIFKNDKKNRLYNSLKNKIYLKKQW